jgi:hypothetical protein
MTAGATGQNPAAMTRRLAMLRLEKDTDRRSIDSVRENVLMAARNGRAHFDKAQGEDAKVLLGRMGYMPVSNTAT